MNEEIRALIDEQGPDLGRTQDQLEEAREALESGKVAFDNLVDRAEEALSSGVSRDATADALLDMIIFSGPDVSIAALLAAAIASADARALVGVPA